MQEEHRALQILLIPMMEIVTHLNYFSTVPTDNLKQSVLNTKINIKGHLGGLTAWGALNFAI